MVVAGIDSGAFEGVRASAVAVVDAVAAVATAAARNVAAPAAAVVVAAAAAAGVVVVAATAAVAVAAVVDHLPNCHLARVAQNLYCMLTFF